jgi:DNA polymerase I
MPPATVVAAPPSVAVLVRHACRDGVTFRLRGAEVVTKHADRTSPDVLARLREHKAEVWDYIGGTELDQPSINLLAWQFPGIHLTLPQTEAEALAVITQIEADADANPHAKGLLGFDIETQANQNEEIRQPVRIGRDGAVSQQPALDPEHLRRPANPRSTAGLNPHRSTVRLAQLYGGADVVLVLDTNLVPLSVLAPVLSRRKAVIHNTAFELAFLHHAGLPLPQYECTMHAAGLLIGNHRRGLDDAAHHFLHLDLPKDLQTSDWGAPILSPGQLAYAALDAIIALKLWPLLLQQFKNNNGPVGAYVLQRSAILPTVRMQARGVIVDQAGHQQERDEWALKRAEAHQQLTALLGKPPPDTPAKIRSLLERVLPADVLASWPRTDKSNELSTADKNLKRVMGIPEIDLVRIMKTQEKLLSSFGTRLVAKISSDGRLRASFNLAGAKTGRMRCSAPNLQNLPRELAFRNCFVAAPGHVFVIGDYSTMELRAVAEIAGDDTLRQDFANNVNLHRRLAAQMHNIPEDQITEEQRRGAKAINFGTIYGAGGPGLAASAWVSYGIVLTPAEAQAARDRFLGRYRMVALWMRTNADNCQRKGVIEVGIHGRVIRAEWEQSNGTHWGGYRRSYNNDGLDGDEDDENGSWDDDEELAAFYANADSRDYGHSNPNYNRPPPSPLKYTLACNAPVQGACADIVMRAMVLIDSALIKAGIPGGLVLSVHDELVLEVPEEFAEQVRQLLEQCMTQAFHEYFPQAPTNGLVEAKVCGRWGEAKS